MSFTSPSLRRRAGPAAFSAVFPAALLGMAFSGFAAAQTKTLGAAVLLDLLPDAPAADQAEAFQAVGSSGSEAYVLPLLDLLRHAATPEEWFRPLDALTPLIGEDARALKGPWWTLWERRLEGGLNAAAPPGYRAFKTALLAQEVDPAYGRMLAPELPSRIPFEEIQWGGVEVDGIPALEDPKAVPASEASFLGDDARVFGIVIHGEARAYPGQILDWHEMANDVLGGEPLALSWCTLCGAPIAYRAVRGKDETRLRFGSSGLLYRSNKLMFDRETETLWNQLTGRPVLGSRIADGDTAPLEKLPLRTTTWGAWRAEFPETTVVSPSTGHERDYSPGAAYGDYFASAKLMFPVPRGEDSYVPKEGLMVAYGPTRPYAARISELRRARVMRFGEGEAAVTLLALPGTPASAERDDSTPAAASGWPPTLDARAFATRDLQLRWVTPLTLEDQAGRTWQVADNALVTASAPPCPEVVCHPLFGFAWGAQLANGEEETERVPPYPGRDQE